MRAARGFTIVELLVAAFAASLVLLGLVSMYLWTTRAFGASSARVALQRQGTLVVEQIGRSARTATGVSPVSVVECNGHPGALRLNTEPTPTCYYPGPAGELCQDTGAGCRNLLAGALLDQLAVFDRDQRPIGAAGVALVIKPLTAELSEERWRACPSAVAPGQICLDATAEGDTRARVAFAIGDGLHVMAFEVSITCAGRTCGPDLPR